MDTWEKVVEKAIEESCEQEDATGSVQAFGGPIRSRLKSKHTVDLATEVTLTKKVRAGSVDLWEQKPDSSSHLIEFPE